MKYVKAEKILPESLLIEIQSYIQGETLYIPKTKKSYRKWGSRSGARVLLDERNSCIREDFNRGVKIDQLADNYHLSCETIKKIVYKK
jgi:Mor family transcriptional regulator